MKAKCQFRHSEIFLAETSITQNLHLPGLKKNILGTKLKTFLFHASNIGGLYSLFRSDIGIF